MKIEKALFIALFTTGAASMIYQVVLMRELTIVLGATEIAASIILSSFMLGLAIGGKYIGRYSESITDELSLFVKIEFIIALCALYLIPVSRFLPKIGHWYIELIIAILAMLPPTILMGGEIPISAKILSKAHKKTKIGEHVGFAYSADTVGGIIGAFSAGFFLIPYMGVVKTVLFGAFLNVISGIVLKYNDKLPSYKFTEYSILIIVFVSLFTFSQLNLKSFETYMIDLYYPYKLLYTEQTMYQRIDIINNTDYGKSLFLNGQLQLTVEDEPFYHEALVHQVMALHPNPKDILIIGGGDGGALREVIKYNVSATMVELDPRMIFVAETLLPEISQNAFKSKKTNLVLGDGRLYIRKALKKGKKFDIIICDLTDPYNDGVASLYTQEFYKEIYNVLNNDGIFITQSTSPYFNEDAFVSVYKTMSSVFEIALPSRVWVPTFGEWGYVLGSKKYNPLTISKETIRNRLRELNLSYFNEDLFFAHYAIPETLKKALDNPKIEITTDENHKVLYYMLDEE